ncbi:Atg38p NDAI_0D00700 [Naumovozyma dairenensis CBS 421]|uniref:Uncharacterized protein n=1 Tax=Naumovozyma dairenensis (strain ATCC 10597 / BCRC 20456 / CBS 421 / NBRC 0211 / NRRL Y-12639) TaxID=1071378 RepID=G0W9C3_NAUDC|nr:hypothetical protein NDAI_0D00700 [Naumovozyma dairenensis CBS 421]CCD24384.1 hypothetical protein NDAI_0D00700 [Naumovozyma dairenensis CBS 421]
MTTLNDIYELIDDAEEESRKGNITNSVRKYKETVKSLEELIKSTKREDINNEILVALDMLKKDISKTICELDKLLTIQRQQQQQQQHNGQVQGLNQRPNSKSSNVSFNHRTPNMLSSLLMNPSVSNTMRYSYNLNYNNAMTNSMNNANVERINPFNDVVIRTITDNLKMNLLESIKGQYHLLNGNAKDERKNDEDEFIKQLNTTFESQFDMFRKELGFYEQKKFSEYDTNLDNLIKENKKLLNQIVKLRERWDSLVESAKQRRNK